MNKLSPEVQQTIKQIQELAARRGGLYQTNGTEFSLTYLCNKVGIYPTTVKQFAPKLYKNWNDINNHSK